MKHTIYDIARVAQVSKSTVSRVLNNQTNISDEARYRVLKAIEELDYQPNKLARALSVGFDAILIVSRSSKTTENNPFFSEIINIISTKAEEENFDVILQNSKNSKDEVKKCITKIREKMIKGIIMLSSPVNEDFFQQLDVFNIPIVVIGKVEGSYTNIYSVDTNNYQDSYELTKYLIEQGHRDIACFHSPLEYHVSIDRLEGYKGCMKDNNLPLHNDWIINSGFNVDSAFNAAKKLLLSDHRPSAVFATDDLKVLSIYKAAADIGITIPADLSIVGYSNSSFSPYLSPSLTSVEIPVKKLGDIGTDILFKKIKGDKSLVISKVVTTERIINNSVKTI
ncbi:LacI family transcriptional regulator [Priestia filamentosa]|uniref:LacI family transcriptional regulator n=1 Tax=Priestia filamentosa TaxID=1402861 RepID=A0A1X7EM00_9BACI|nr:LacI family DNA-binding transcriptional regulator [Priestia filamentosa]AKO93169.1 LacI family transcriptional regulator [Priestia filamentosa]MDT3763305.1 LacI family DNA-binding transcriptional regulator [Priestia filamentosa]OXS69808.1 LacI family transcriptional regulator [Priestia filamentosa]WRU93769.1 LacI family DNA-binding transcriptional regulator [Priestia filamentosa]SMF36434.1 transcriptional regulator, LacI family [Priestia filamentosa]